MMRRRAEEALRESEEKFRTFFESSSSAMAIIEKDTTISMVNKEYCKMGLYEEKDVIGTSWTKQIPPEDLERLKEYNRKRLTDPKSAPDHYEFSFYRKDGTIRNSLMSVAIIPANQKIICSFTDITERKQMENALREAAEEREKLIKELQYALDNVKTLQGLIPICASCKKIRDDKGFWNQVEGYISQHTDAKFTHGICPDCAKKLYGDVYEKTLKKT
jgi:PAS domain S-box-containing protein